MTSRAHFAYAYARLQNHYGRRPSPAVWRHLETAKTLGNYLETARRSGLSDWVVKLTANSSSHGIENALRADWLFYVERVSSWMPRAWRPAILWVGQLAELPMIAHLARGHAAAEWMRPEIKANVPSRRAVAHWAAGDQPLAEWIARLRQRLPQSTTGDIHDLDKLFGLVGGYLGTGSSLPTAQSREQLTACLERMFRRHAQKPVATFAFLGVVALDIEKMRAQLIRRALFPETLYGD